MDDEYDFASAIKDVSKQMPEAARAIREYIDVLKSKIVVRDNEQYEDTDFETIVNR